MNPRMLIVTTICLAVLATTLWGGTPHVGATPSPTNQAVLAPSASDTCQTEVTVTDYNAAHQRVSQNKFIAEKGVCDSATTSSLKLSAASSDSFVEPKEDLSGFIPKPSDPSVTSRIVDVARTRLSSVFGATLFKYHHTVSWGWGLTTVFPGVDYASFSNVDQTYVIITPYFAWTHYFYMLGWNNPLSGYLTKRQGAIRFGFCWPVQFCSHYYPWVIIREHGDGSATWQRGD